MDVTLLRLAAWFPDVCRDVTCLKVKDVSRRSVRDRHLAPFTNARFLQVWDCDRLTDAALLQFTQMDSLKVIDCPGITGACVSPLVTDHELYCIEYWSFHIGSEPCHVFIAPSVELQYLVSGGALQMYMTTEHTTDHAVHFWKYNGCHIQKCKQAPLHISCKARLPPSCALSVSASLCSNVHVVPLLRHALAPVGMRRERVEVVCGGGAGQDALGHFSLHKRPELPAQVRAAFACVRDARLVAVDGLGRALDEQPDGDGAAALSRLRADPETEGVAALWAYMGLT